MGKKKKDFFCSRQKLQQAPNPCNLPDLESQMPTHKKMHLKCRTAHFHAAEWILKLSDSNQRRTIISSWQTVKLNRRHWQEGEKKGFWLFRVFFLSAFIFSTSFKREEALEILIWTQRCLIEMHLSWQIEPNGGGGLDERRGAAAAVVVVMVVGDD